MQAFRCTDQFKERMLKMTALLIFIAMVCVAIMSACATSLWKDKNEKFINFVSSVIGGLPVVTVFLVGTIIFLLG